MESPIASRYELREKLGSSATATVWRARDRRRRRDVALKVANDQPADVSSRRQLAAEADATARLHHPNIVPLLDAHLGRNEAALAFSYVGGETLARRLASSKRLEPAQAAALAADLAAALAHAHARGVVHRDVKPGNVMVDKDGHARLFDFGISATPERGGGALVQPGMTTGTLPYMSPEQLEGRPADPASDVYALGAVLYEMLAGHRPFAASTAEELAAQQARPPAPVDDAPAALVELAAAAMDPDPNARPTAAAFGRSLRSWLAGAAEAVTIVVPTVPQTSVVPLMPASAVVPALVPPAVAIGQPARKSPPWLVLIAGALVLVALVVGSLALAGGLLGTAAPTTAPTTLVPASPTFAMPTTVPVVQDGGGTGSGGSGGSGGGGNNGGGGNHGGNGKGGHGKGH